MSVLCRYLTAPKATDTERMFDTLRVLELCQALYKHPKPAKAFRYAVVYSIILSLYKISFAHARGLL